MLSIMVTQDKLKGGLNAKALYLDTENKFRPERIVSIARARNFDPDKVLQNIRVAKVINTTDQEITLQNANSIIGENNVKLLVVDSVIGHYKAEYRARLSERQQKLNKFMRALLSVAQTHGTAVVITNH